MLTTVIAAVLAPWYLFNLAASDFMDAKLAAERQYDHCEWNYVGKQDLDPTAQAIELNPPVGKPYILFKQKCWDNPPNVIEDYDWGK